MDFMNTWKRVSPHSVAFGKILNVWLKLFKNIQIMKLKENQEKNATSRYRTNITKTQCAWSGIVQHQTDSVTEPSISLSIITCTVQVNWTSLLRQNNDEKFSKVTKNMPS